MLALDHIVVAAPSLAEGVAHVRDATGIEMPKGGEHPLMGTHNHLLRLGTDEFLEVIAVNPEAPAPSRPRWFGLDHPVQTPRLSHWVLRCDDMAVMRPLMPELLGPAIKVTRGDLSWHLTVPEDGSLPMAGVMPSLLEWHVSPLPPTRMQGAGVELRSLTLCHPEVHLIEAALAPHLRDERIRYEVGPVALVAELSAGGRDFTLR